MESVAGQDVCPICESEPASPAHFGCCSDPCERDAHYTGDTPCPAIGPRGYLCTRAAGHAGRHVAGGTARCESWPGTGASAARPADARIKNTAPVGGAKLPPYLVHLAWAYQLAPDDTPLGLVLEGLIERALFAICEVHRLDPLQVIPGPDAVPPAIGGGA